MPGQQGASFLPLPLFSSLPQEVADRLTSGQRRRLLADANAAVRGLHYLHGEGHRGPIAATATAATSEKVSWLQRDVQQRVLHAALRWIDVDSAINEKEALAKLLKGKAGYAPAASTSVGSYEYSRVSLPESVLDAPSALSMPPAEDMIFLEEFESRMLLPAEEADLIQRVQGAPGRHADPFPVAGPRTHRCLVKRAVKDALVDSAREPRSTQLPSS